MIFVILGTQKEQFTRLLRYVENIKTKQKIIVQAGYTKYESNKMKILSFIPTDQMERLMQDADIIITHTGTGSVLTALSYGKKVIACPRLKKYKEHVDDHQLELLNLFVSEGYILGANSQDDIDMAISEIGSFMPKQYKSNTASFISKLRKVID